MPPARARLAPVGGGPRRPRARRGRGARGVGRLRRPRRAREQRRHGEAQARARPDHRRDRPGDDAQLPLAGAHGARRSSPAMLARGSGLIVNVGSVGGRFGIIHEAAYCAAKFALSGWSEVMAMDLAGTGVRVKLVLPGPIATEIWGTPEGDLPALLRGPFRLGRGVRRRHRRCHRGRRLRVLRARGRARRLRAEGVRPREDARSRRFRRPDGRDGTRLPDARLAGDPDRALDYKPAAWFSRPRSARLRVERGVGG